MHLKHYLGPAEAKMELPEPGGIRAATHFWEMTLKILMLSTSVGPLSSDAIKLRCMKPLQYHFLVWIL